MNWEMLRELGQVSRAAAGRTKEIGSAMDSAVAEVAAFPTFGRITLAGLAWSMAIDSFPTGVLPPGRQGWVVNCLDARIWPLLKEAIEGDRLVIRDALLGFPRNAEVRQRGELPLDAVVLKADLLAWCRAGGHAIKWLPLEDEDQQSIQNKPDEHQDNLEYDGRSGFRLLRELIEHLCRSHGYDTKAVWDAMFAMVGMPNAYPLVRHKEGDLYYLDVDGKERSIDKKAVGERVRRLRKSTLNPR